MEIKMNKIVYAALLIGLTTTSSSVFAATTPAKPAAAVPAKPPQTTTKGKMGGGMEAIPPDNLVTTIQDLMGDLSNLQKSFTALTATFNGLQSTLTGDVTTLDTQLNDPNEGYTAQLNSDQLTYNNMLGFFNGCKPEAENCDTNIPAVAAAVTTAQQKLSEANASVSYVETTFPLSTIQGDLATLQALVTKVGADLTGTDNDLSTLDTSNLTSLVGYLQYIDNLLTDAINTNTCINKYSGTGPLNCPPPLVNATK
jgi:hypothetical protein